MITPTEVLGWLAIGAAASLGGMIWPFRRGTVGVVINGLFGMTGAVLGPLGGLLVFGTPSDTNALLGFAAGGAFAMLGLAHVGWFVFAGRAHRIGRDSLISAGGRPR